MKILTASVRSPIMVQVLDIDIHDELVKSRVIERAKRQMIVELANKLREIAATLNVEDIKYTLEDPKL